jgi:hypothetical protein
MGNSAIDVKTTIDTEEGQREIVVKKIVIRNTRHVFLLFLINPGIIKDIPEGKIIYWFENVDMAIAKRILGDRICIMGNVPMWLLATGTTDKVEEYCRALLESVGSDGGFIMSSAAVLEDARVEKVRALVDFTRVCQ